MFLLPPRRHYFPAMGLLMVYYLRRLFRLN
jgi:hypothetical protein